MVVRAAIWLGEFSISGSEARNVSEQNEGKEGIESVAEQAVGEEVSGGIFINPVVFRAAAILIIGFSLLGIFAPDQVGEAFDAIQSFIVVYFGWLYILAVGFILIFVVGLGLSRYGNIRLGPNDSRPEYSNLTWFSMLFSAGMGIGLLFYSVAEPILHYSSPPNGEGMTIESAKEAMNLTFFHWGLHPWAVYTLVGLSLGYFAYRRGHPLTIRSAFFPLLGEHTYGWAGNVIDIIASVSTLFGVATSLGLGAMQVNAGFNHVFDVPEATGIQIVLIAAITAVATVSVITGINVGIRRLSEFNIIAAGVLILFVLLVGPTVFLARMFVQSSGHYLQNLPSTTLWTATFQGPDWQGAWTIFYWGWWIAWSPFVGMFIARVSRGRTIREFIFGVLLCPTVATFAWLSIFGGTALFEEIYGVGRIVEAVEESVPVALFQMFETLPLATIASVLATIVIISFFVTSSDSASLVINIITSGGHPNPPIPQRIFWAILEGVVAAVLLLAGGLVALQTAAITTALPFCVMLLVMCYSIVKGLQQERAIHRRPTFEPPDDYTPKADQEAAAS